MKILVLNQNILAVDPVDSGDSWATEDQIIPKHVCEGAALVTVVALPDDYSPGRYRWINGDFSRIPDPVVRTVPQVVSRAQGKAALISKGYWGDVVAFVAGIADPTQKALAEVALNDTQEWRRDSAFVAQCGGVLGLTGDQLDDLFIFANSITF